MQRLKGAVENGKPAIPIETQEKELARLIGGEAEAQPRFGEPAGEVAGAEDLEDRLRGGGWRCALGPRTHEKAPGKPPSRVGIIALRPMPLDNINAPGIELTSSKRDRGASQLGIIPNSVAPASRPRCPLPPAIQKSPKEVLESI
jgi:hypothetical protein